MVDDPHRGLLPTPRNITLRHCRFVDIYHEASRIAKETAKLFYRPEAFMVDLRCITRLAEEFDAKFRGVNGESIFPFIWNRYVDVLRKQGSPALLLSFEIWEAHER